MKISILSNLYPPTVLGGAELSAYFTAQELVRQGHEVSVFTIADADGLSVEQGIRVHRIKSRPFYSPYVTKKQPKWMKPIWHGMDLYNPMMGRQVAKALEAENPDVLHCHNIVGFSCAVWEAARKARVPVVQHLHDFHLVCLKATLMDDKLESCANPHFPCNYRADYHFRMLARNVRHVISPSAFTGRKLFGYARQKAATWNLHVIPNGTDYAGLPPVIGDWKADRLKVLFLGALFDHKGFGLLAEAIDLVNRQSNAFEFRIGGKGPLESRALELQARYANVRYHGFVGGEEKLRLFRQSHAFIFPSICLENNPVSITEALALGLPVIGSEIGGVPELLEPVSPGLLFKPGSAQIIAEKLLAAERDREALRGVSDLLLGRRPKYGLTAQVQNILAIYREAVECGPAERSPATPSAG